MKKFGLTDKEVAESKEKYGDNSMTEQSSESFMDKLTVRSTPGEGTSVVMLRALPRRVRDR